MAGENTKEATKAETEPEDELDELREELGGLILAIATEHCNLHLRIALVVMKTLGCSHAKLLGGLCTVTTFISMWIANAAATAMMVPIVFAVLYELERQGLGQVFNIKIDPKQAEPVIRPTNVTKAYLFAAGYASSFGGTGAIVGTPTNLAFKGIYEYTFPEAEPINFGNWIVGSFPQMVANSFILWIYLRVAYLGFLRPRSKDAEAATIGEDGERIANEVIREKLQNLGPMSFHEICVAILFTTCVVLWVFRAPGFILGWSALITDVNLADSTPVMLICFLMFVIPKEPSFIYFCSKDPTKKPKKSSEGLMTWDVIQRKMPWRLVILLGGGFAVSKASNISGLAMKVGLALVPLKYLPPTLMLFVVLLFVNTLTELTSNVGTANIILPVVGHMCVAMRIHPLYLMMPVALMCSYAFRLPVSTPPNAIITAAGHMPTTTKIVDRMNESPPIAEAEEPARSERPQEGGFQCLRETGKFLRLYWKIIFAILWAVILLPFLLCYNSPEVRCAYVVLLMAGYWIAECFPMAITSLIPVVLFPTFGILSTAETCACYMNDTIMVFLGGLILAVAIEHSNLHLRIALGVMKVTGCSHGKLLGGLCVVTTFISMWISNTAATAMMVPIIFAILYELERAGFGNVFKIDESDPENPDIEPTMTPTKITKAYLLAAAYCATFGGTGTLVGTGTNLTFKGIYESIFPASEGISFIQWMIASFPQMVINTFLTWFYVRVAYLGYLRPHSQEAKLATIGAEGEIVTNQVIQDRYKNLGPITFHEVGVATLFLMCIFLWIFRKPGFVRGWAEMITDIDVKDSTPVIFASIMMFFIPKDLNFLYSCSSDPTKRPSKSSEGLITWKVIETRMPWGLMFLLGGGFAISKGSISSCLAKKIGESLIPLRYLPSTLILALICLFVGSITEFTSNVGVANITLPVIAQMCVAMEIHPLYFMVPATLMCSFSFRLPVGTPPNAIVTLAGHIPTKWLITGGCIPAIYSLIVEVILFPTWGAFVYGIKEYPAWATQTQASGTDSKCN
ncbi:hypothetical protein KM043_012546 [Ampulex compressa]|nr:hypothetical protein KM043_012546 [Ampulex compressa]